MTLSIALAVAALVVGVLEVRIAQLGRQVAELREQLDAQPKPSEPDDDAEDAHGAASNA